jgi:hypothetical protein
MATKLCSEVKTPALSRVIGGGVQDNDDPAERKLPTVPDDPRFTRDVVKVKNDEFVWIKFYF